MAGTLAGRVSDWLFGHALPWWLANGWDSENGGAAIEAVRLSGQDAGLEYRRTRVICRQIYVFSHAHVLGWSNGLERAAEAAQFLTERVWTSAEAGFPKRTTRAGAIDDPTIDLYDHAFAMLGFAWHTRASDSQHSRDWLYRTIDFIEERLRHPTAPGFHHQLPRDGWRLQNPHMHLTEACLAAYDATGDNRFRNLCEELSGLFNEYFFDQEQGILRESFTDDLRPIPGPDSDLLEPGHHFEWAWILGELRRHVSRDISPQIQALIANTERHGVDPLSFATYNAIGPEGQLIDGGSRLWPNTERLKAACALHDLTGADPSRVFEQTLGLLFDRYLDCELKGLWKDAFNRQGELTARNTPASTFYHIMLAFAEVLRIEPDA